MVGIEIFRKSGKMKTSLIFLILVSLVFFCCGQRNRSVDEKITTQVEAVASRKTKKSKIITFDPRSYTESDFQYTEEFIDTEFKYTDSTGNDIIIQNSFPKGRDYYDSTGRYEGCRLFWTRIINETTSPIDLSIDFPAESFLIYNVPDAYFKLFLPPDTVSIDELSTYSWGISDLNSFLDTDIDKSILLDRTINPNEEYIFFTGLLVPNGTVRAGIVTQQQDLFYRVSIDPFGSTKIPCGQIIVKN
jgi:hypothetical protein